MERRLIDANALMKNVGKIPQLRGITYGRMKKAVEETTTIDAVEVVRCRDYAYMHVPRCCPYQIAGFKVDDDWYCPMGVRREPDGK